MAEQPKDPNQPRDTFLLDPSGEPVRVPMEEAQALLELGWGAASKEQASQALVDEKFSTTGQQAATFAEGAADALTLGASSFAETKLLGVSPEDIANRERVNPGARLAGQVVGIAAPILATAGAAALPSGIKGAAALTAPALASKAGAGVAKAVGAALPNATSALGKLGVAAAKAGAAGAVEGGIFGVQNVVHEAALGDPNLTAQSALEEIGISALLGGGLGAAGGAAASAVSQLAGKAAGGKLGQKIAEWFPEFEGERNLKAAGAIQGDINQATKRISREELNKIGREAGELGLVGPFSTPGKTLERAEALMAKAGGKMDEALRAADGVGSPRGMPEISKRVRKEVIEALERNPLERGTAKAMSEFVDDYAKLYPEDQLSFKALHDVRRQVDKKLYGLRGNQDPMATALKDSLHDFRTVISDEIETGMRAVGLGDDAWKAASREYQVAAQVSKFAEKGLNRGVGNNLVSPMEMLSGIGGFISGGIPASAIMGLGTAAARRFGSGLLGAGARALRGSIEAEGAAVAGKTAQVLEQEAASGALSQFARANKVVAKRIDDMALSVIEGGARVARAETAFAGAAAVAASAEERMARLQQVAQNPEVLHEAIARQTEDIGESAPNVSMAMQVASSRAVQFLASKMPKLPPATPLGRPPSLSKQQAWEFNLYYDAVDDPTSVLALAAEGMLTPQSVEAVKTVYPELYAQMTSSLFDKVTSKKDGAVPYSQRLMLSMLLGQDVDGTTTPESIRAAQDIRSMPQQKSQELGGPSAIGRPTQRGLANMDVASKAMTPAQATSARMNGGT